MAITQNRMLSLIHIADEFKSTLFYTQQFIQDTIKELPKNPSNSDLLSALQSIQQYSAAISFSPAAIENLANEKAHFKLNARRNERSAHSQRRKRGTDESATPARSTAPRSINPQVPDQFASYLAPYRGIALRGDLTPTPASPKLYGAAAASYAAANASPQPMSDAELSKYVNLELSSQKAEINAFCTSHNMPIPYPDIYDDETPLTDDHKLHFGQAPLGASSDDSIF